MSLISAVSISLDSTFNTGLYCGSRSTMYVNCSCYSASCYPPVGLTRECPHPVIECPHPVVESVHIRLLRCPSGWVSTSGFWECPHQVVIHTSVCTLTPSKSSWESPSRLCVVCSLSWRRKIYTTFFTARGIFGPTLNNYVRVISSHFQPQV